MITTSALTKRFGRMAAVDALDLDVRRGDIYGFLGANGSGKTTTVRMILGLVLATSGTIELLGEPMPKSRHVLHRVGALIESPAAYPHLSGFANLWLLESSGRGAGSRSRRRQAIGDALDRVGLGRVGSRPVKAYSLGMRQRLGLAAALVRQPELLVLDEPTNGLDPHGIREIRALLLELHRAGTTVFLSSHLLAEIEQMCSRVGVLDHGRLVVQDALETLRTPTGRVAVRSPDAAEAVALLDGRVEHRDGDRMLVRAASPEELNALLVGNRIRVAELAPERRTLEDVILELTAGSGDVR